MVHFPFLNRNGTAVDWGVEMGRSWGQGLGGKEEGETVVEYYFN